MPLALAVRNPQHPERVATEEEHLHSVQGRLYFKVKPKCGFLPELYAHWVFLWGPLKLDSNKHWKQKPTQKDRAGETRRLGK